ncbi:hypothetical protein GS584_25640, partial [Rhodococcus hoagii]|nr:hypothetical protein [Prescottella equi]
MAGARRTRCGTPGPPDQYLTITTRGGFAIARHPDGTPAWFDRGEAFALATVVRTWKSSPRTPGAA